MKKQFLVKTAAGLLVATSLSAFETQAQELKVTPMVTAPRVLKKRIDFSFLQTHPFIVKDQTIDLAWPINGQLQLAVNNSPNFYYAGATKPFTPAPTAVTAGKITSLAAFNGIQDVPLCYRNTPQLIVGGAVTGFDFTSSIGLTFGYSPAGNTSGKDLVDVSVDVSTSTMTLNLEGDNPISKQIIDMGSASANDTSTTINSTINFANFNISPSFFFSSKLNDVAMKGMTTGLSSLASSPQVSAMPWEAQVTDPADLALTINAGTKAGLKCGDVLDIYNQTYFYDPSVDPCKTTAVTHFDSDPTGQPSATITIRHLQPDASMTSGDDIVWFDLRGVQAGAVVRQNKTLTDAHPERCN